MPPAEMTLSATATDFIDDAYLSGLTRTAAEPSAVRDVIAKGLEKQALSVEETAVLLSAEEPAVVEDIFDAARRLKRLVYGNRIVLFAPLYVGNRCVNDCAYCAFRRGNPATVRRTLSADELSEQVRALEDVGHKRLILVFGEHPDYDADFIADCVRRVYATRSGRGEIRRVNINAAPMDHDGYGKVKDAGIGTYQIFMETYHHEAYARAHPAATRKGDYLYRLDALSRAFEAGCDDVGIGALFGLADWKFDVLGLVAHARFLQDRHGVGPHTISFPRLRPAAGTNLDPSRLVGDAAFKRIVAILRLAVPYTGLILTAREPAELRREVMAFGVSQIDAGSRIAIGGYTGLSGDRLQGSGSQHAPQARKLSPDNLLRREQFTLGDIRGLDDVVRELLTDGYVPSWCTACYRLGRTGEHFMEFAIPGFIQRFCTPNALSTLTEYLADYAGPATRAAGEVAIAAELSKMRDGSRKQELIGRLRRIRQEGERDLYC